MEECKYCDKEFDKKRRKLQHELKEHEGEMSSHDRDGKKRELSKLREKDKTAKQKRNRKIIYSGIGLVLLAGLVFGGYQVSQYADSLQPEKDADKGIGTPIHWHANYQLTVCGENQILRGGPTRAHTHGQSQFHLEGVRTSEEQATLDGIVDSLGGQLENNSVMGQTSCNGEPAELTVKANGQELENPLTYIPRDGDNIVIRLE
ncbi:hypothetical protein [Candidatus Nanohalovita haloferacivicina]|jgi:hypothetical protein|uniref:hypothetical protein n=1 Tax=Candidatus Nanohalovita haloferacivicina TaxID=2978046 RepID=UPI00325FDC93|nr:hypothetical protein HBNXNv_0235 [Candidatus Nanohalobia archaeon BNXNv]